MFKKTILTAAAALLISNSPTMAGEITIGMAPNLQTLPIVVASSEGYFNEEKIKLKNSAFYFWTPRT